MQKRSTFIIALAALSFVLLLAARPAPAEAGIRDALRNLWNSLRSQLSVPAPAPVEGGPVDGVPEEQKAPEAPAPLYKPAYDYERAVIDAVKKASPAVVAITISKNVPVIEQCPGASPWSDLPPEFRQFFGDQPQFTVPCEKGTRLERVGGGSGFFVSPDGLILTNKHVVSDTKASYTVFTNDGKKYDARVLARDPVQDLAVIKVDGAGFPTVELGDSSSIELGQTAIAIGNALGEFRNTVSVGTVSGLARTITASGGDVGRETLQGLIQTDAAINPGNSGGPLLNLRGQVIGVNTAVAANAQNIGFAIPVNRARRDIDAVRAGGKIEAPYLGVHYITVTPEVAAAQKLPVEEGALVRGSSDGPGVAPGSPAEKAGLLAEDIIIAIDGKKIDRDNPLSSFLADRKPGDGAKLTVRRGEKEITLTATLGARP